MGGPGIMFSANFDTRFIKSRQTGLGIRFGVGFTVKDNEEYTDPNGNIQYRFRTIGTIPVGINYLLGRKHHHIHSKRGRHYYIDIQSRDAKL
jgi:hypothetical protein